MAEPETHPVFEDLPYPQDRHDGDVPITKAMATAGAAVLRGYGSWESDSPADELVVAEIFTAMQRASRVQP